MATEIPGFLSNMPAPKMSIGQAFSVPVAGPFSTMPGNPTAQSSLPQISTPNPAAGSAFPQISTPTPKPVATVQTSDTARTQTQTNLKDLAVANTAASLPPQQTKTTTPATPTTKNTAGSTQPPLVPPTPSATENKMTYEMARSVFGNDFTGVIQNADGTFTPDSSAMSRITKTQEKSTSSNNQPDLRNVGPDAQTRIYLDQMSNLAASSDTRSKAIIDSINREYDSLAKSQEVANQAYQGGVTSEGIVSGRARYAPTIQMGIFNGAVSAGVKALADLRAKQSRLVLDAEQARDEGAFKRLNDIMTAYRTNVKDQRDVLQNTYENTMRASQEARAQSEEKRKELTNILDNSATTVSQSLRGITDETIRDKTISSYAKSLGIDPVSLKNSVLKYQDTQNEKIQTTILSLGKDYPDAGITDQDLINGSMDSVMQKVAASSTYMRKGLKERAEINKLLAEAAKAKMTLNDTSDLSYFSETLATTGQMPPGVAGKYPIGVIYNMAKDYAKENLSEGAVIDKATGITVKPGKISDGVRTSLNAAYTLVSAVPNMRATLDEIVTFPGSGTVIKAGKIVKLSSDDQIKFNVMAENSLSLLVQSRSGLAASDKERERLAALIPRQGQWKDYNSITLDTFEDEMKRQVSKTLDQYNTSLNRVDLRTRDEVVKSQAKVDKI